MREPSEISEALLGWYERHARNLPWRVRPQAARAGARPDPYAIWLSEVMLQQTTVAAVRGYFERFMARWPDVHALANAADDELMAAWAGLGYYARARNLLACARAVVADHGGAFPASEEALRRLPGIGPYTAAAIAAIAFDLPAVVVDGNVERVVARLFAETEPLPAVKPALRTHAARLTPEIRAGDHAQAMMDLGATICTPRSPACGICPLASDCRARASGLAAALPARKPKAPKPVRRGTLWVARRDDGAWLLERRPARGLLGGMLGWPGSGWEHARAAAGGESGPPARGAWRSDGLEVRHTFTHFDLIAELHVARLPLGAVAGRGEFVPADAFDPDALPSLMRKAWDMARGALG